MRRDGIVDTMAILPDCCQIMREEIPVGIPSLRKCVPLLFDSGCYLLGQLFHFFRLHFDMVVEVQICLGLHGHEVNMGVGHFQSQHGHTYFGAGACFFQPDGHTAGKTLQFAVEFFIEVEDIVNLLFGDAEHMPFHYGVYIEES